MSYELHRKGFSNPLGHLFDVTKNSELRRRTESSLAAHALEELERLDVSLALPDENRHVAGEVDDG